MAQALVFRGAPTRLLRAREPEVRQSAFWSAAVLFAAMSLLESPFHSINSPIGNLRYVCESAFAGLGLCLWLQRRPSRVHLPSLRTCCLGLAVAVGGANVLSIDSAFSSVFQFLRLGFLVVGVVGLASHYSVHQLTKLVLVVMILNLASSVGFEILLGTFRPEQIDYRFAGFSTPLEQGLCCGLLGLSAVALVRHTRRNLPLYFGLIAVSLLFLLLTKSLLSGVAFLAAIIVEIALPLKHFRKWIIMAIGIISIAGLIVVDQGGHPWPDGNLRILSVDFLERIVKVSIQPAVAELLQKLGILGLVLLAIVLGTGIRHAYRRYQETLDEGYRFLIAQLILGSIHALAQWSSVEHSAFVALLAASLASMSMEPRQSPLREVRVS